MIKVEMDKTKVEGNMLDVALELGFLLKALAKNTDKFEKALIMMVIKKSIMEDF